MLKIIASILTLTLLAGCIDYSDGDRVGIVTKLSRKGLFCKTWEGQMNLGGMRKEDEVSSDGKSVTSVMVPNTWDFTVEDEALLPAVRVAMDSGKTVKISYHAEVFAPCRSDSSATFATAINQ